MRQEAFFSCPGQRSRANAAASKALTELLTNAANYELRTVRSIRHCIGSAITAALEVFDETHVFLQTEPRQLRVQPCFVTHACRLVTVLRPASTPVDCGPHALPQAGVIGIFNRRSHSVEMRMQW